MGQAPTRRRPLWQTPEGLKAGRDDARALIAAALRADRFSPIRLRLTRLLRLATGQDQDRVASLMEASLCRGDKGAAAEMIDVLAPVMLALSDRP